MTNDHRQFLSKLRSDIQFHYEDRIFKFWSTVPVDERGGFYGYVTNDNMVDPEAEKGLVMTARYLWSFSAMYGAFRDPRALELATHALDFLMESLWDRERGGFYWLADAAGKPLDKKKQVYGQAFALYAMAEYCRIHPEPEVVARCSQVFELLETRAKDSVHGGYWESCTEDWQVVEVSALSEVDTACAKSMNTHLHVLEAYTNYARLVGTGGVVAGALRDLIQIHLVKILSPTTHHLTLYFNQDWTKLPGPTSYGHDIEASWLLEEALEILGDWQLKKAAAPIIIKILKASLEGLAGETLGGERLCWLQNEIHDGNVDRTRIWWVQAEALVGLMNGWQITRDPYFCELLGPLYRHIELVQACPDGDWYWEILPNGRPGLDRPKAGAWKTPYHNTRACLELIRRIDKEISNAKF